MELDFGNFGQKSNFWSKIEILVKTLKFCPKIEVQSSKFSSSKFVIKNGNFS